MIWFVDSFWRTLLFKDVPSNRGLSKHKFKAIWTNRPSHLVAKKWIRSSAAMSSQNEKDSILRATNLIAMASTLVVMASILRVIASIPECGIVRSGCCLYLKSKRACGDMVCGCVVVCLCGGDLQHLLFGLGFAIFWTV